MFNDELYKELEQYYSVERMIDFAEIMVTRYDFICNDIVDGGFSEDTFEKDWWYNKYVELKNAPKDRIIKDVNDIDYFLLNLQKELNKSYYYIEKLRVTIKEKGYTSLSDIPKL